MSELTIVTASLDSPEWLELFVKSVRKFSITNPDIIIIDNGSLEDNLTWIRYQKNIVLYEAKKNLGHGGSMDKGTELAKTKYVCFLDIDSHPMVEAWDRELILLYESMPNVRLIGCVGPAHKPLHPPLFFYEKEFIQKNNISFRYIPEVSTDTAQKAYGDILALGFRVHRLKKGMKRYGCIGDEIHGSRGSLIYHHWYGTRFRENNPQKKIERLDGYTLEEHLEHKGQLFENWLVKEILAYKKDIVFRDYMECRKAIRELKGMPWIEKGAIDILEKAITKDSTILEVGSGSSTIWFARKAKHVLSFEHNELWYSLVRDELEHQELDNVDLRYEPQYPEEGLPNVKGKFDIVLIDGPTEGRNNPIEVGIKHIKPGGYFVLDDAHRMDLYREGLKLLEKQGWQMWNFNIPGFIRHTRVWKAT